MEQHAAEVAALCEAVLAGDGEADGATRQAAYDGAGLTGRLAAYVAKVHDCAYRITDADVAALRSDGLSEDAIFEITLAAAIGAAHRRLQAGLDALTEAS